MYQRFVQIVPWLLGKNIIIFLMQNMDELVEQEQELVQQALMQDVEALDFCEKQPKCGQNIQIQFWC
ncbi:Creatine kinase U-type mitochondrial [Bienertia sinuspersici]